MIALIKQNFVDLTELAYCLFVYIFEIFHGSVLFSIFVYTSFK